MRIAVFNGSPKGPGSVTHRMVDSFLKGALDAGAEGEEIFLNQKKIHHCIGCFACWVKTPGRCIIDDDMGELIERIKQADMVIYAGPVYYGSVTGLMKNFIDRTLPLADPHFQKNENGNYRHVDRHEKQPVIGIISNCGFPEMLHFKYFRNIFTFLEENGGASIVAEIYRPMGPLLDSGIEELKPVIGRYHQLLFQAGKEVAEKGHLSASLREELEKPLIPPDKYIQESNRYWDKVLSEM